MSSNIQPYEMKMRAIKRCIVKDLCHPVEFVAVYVSADIAAEMKRTTACEGDIGVDTTWESIPLRVDPELREGSVVYVW